MFQLLSSTSALLLTLILGFIVPSIPQEGTERLVVGLAASFLIIAAALAASALGLLGDAVTDKPVDSGTFRNFYRAQAISFMIGLIFLLVAILERLPPP
jgi:hypothetical protein